MLFRSCGKEYRGRSALEIVDALKQDTHGQSERLTASDFFTSLRQQMDAPPGMSVITEAQRERLKNLMSERDEIITLPARSDPAAAERLSDIYVSYREAMSRVEAEAGGWYGWKEQPKPAAVKQGWMARLYHCHYYYHYTRSRIIG